jgi:hypothetical protein
MQAPQLARPALVGKFPALLAAKFPPLLATKFPALLATKFPTQEEQRVMVSGLWQ